jgi:hypothetical protein
VKKLPLKVLQHINPPSSQSRQTGHPVGLYFSRRPIGFARLDRLTSLFDLFENGVVVKGVLGNDLGRLGLEGDVV